MTQKQNIDVFLSTNKNGSSVFYKSYSINELAAEFRTADKVRSHFSVFPAPKKASFWTDFGSFLLRNDPVSGYISVSPKTHWMIAFNEKGKLISPEMLIGILSPYWDEIRKASTKKYLDRYNHSHGERRQVYGHYRRPRTTQEIRFAQEKDYIEIDDVTGEEIRIPVKFRARKALPNFWDDIYAHGQKSWKKQSRRTRQYKAAP